MYGICAQISKFGQKASQNNQEWFKNVLKVHEFTLHPQNSTHAEKCGGFLLSNVTNCILFKFKKTPLTHFTFDALYQFFPIHHLSKHDTHQNQHPPHTPLLRTFPCISPRQQFPDKDNF